MQTMEYLFVYGTLRSHFNNDMAKFLRAHAKFISNAVTNGSLYLIGWFPGFIPCALENHKVIGEVYAFTKESEAFKTLDSYEGYDPNLNTGEFLRTKTKVFLSNGKSKNCWVYVYNSKVDQKSKIISGDFLKHNI